VGYGDDRPQTIPERRGMPKIPGAREDSYTAASYAAQFGVTVEDAQDLIDRYGRHAHKHIEREIIRMVQADPALKRRAFLLDDGTRATPEEERAALDWLAKLGIKPRRDES
jgi:hypothetical protein